MDTTSHLSPEQLVAEIKKLSLKKRHEFMQLLPHDWLHNEATSPTNSEKHQLNLALEKEAEGKAVFHTWEEVEAYVKNPSRERL